MEIFVVLVAILLWIIFRKRMVPLTMSNDFEQFIDGSDAGSVKKSQDTKENEKICSAA